jgi:hypothetical protein
MELTKEKEAQHTNELRKDRIRDSVKTRSPKDGDSIETLEENTIGIRLEKLYSQKSHIIIKCFISLSEYQEAFTGVKEG